MKEKRTFKKLLSMFLSFVMVVSLITINNVTKTEASGESITIGFKNYSSTNGLGLTHSTLPTDVAAAYIMDIYVDGSDTPTSLWCASSAWFDKNSIGVYGLTNATTSIYVPKGTVLKEYDTNAWAEVSGGKTLVTANDLYIVNNNGTWEVAPTNHVTWSLKSYSGTGELRITHSKYLEEVASAYIVNAYIDGSSTATTPWLQPSVTWDKSNDVCIYSVTATKSIYIPKGTIIEEYSTETWSKVENGKTLILDNDFYIVNNNGTWQEAEYIAPPSDHTPELGENSGLPSGKVNMITNGDCTVQPKESNLSSGKVENGVIRIDAEGQTGMLQFWNLNCEAGHTYNISYYICIRDAKNLSYANFGEGADGWKYPLGTAPTLTEDTDGWQKVEFEYTMTNSGKLNLAFRNNSTNGSATIYIDDIVMYDATKIQTSADLTFVNVTDKNIIQFTIPNDKIQTLKAKDGEEGCWATTTTKAIINGKAVDVVVNIYPYNESAGERWLCLQGDGIVNALKANNLVFEGSIAATYKEEVVTLNFTNNLELERYGTAWTVPPTSEYSYPNGDNVVHYNIDNGTSYVITTTNNLVKVVKDGKEITATRGTELNEVGEYEITKVESGVKYVQKVVLYKNGDADASGNVDICDLVSMKRESENKGCNLAYSADLNRSDKVDSVDLNAMRRALAMGNANTAFVQPKGNSILNGVMPIGGMTGPSYYSGDADKFVNGTVYKALADMGINNVGFNSNDFSDSTQGTIPHDNMKLAEENGIGIYVTDGNCIGGKTFHIAEKDNMLKFIGSYSGYKSFLGMSIVDEPSTDSYQSSGSKKLSSFAPAMSMFNNYANIHGYVSMFPWITETNSTEYSAYMQDVMDAGAEIISYDNYPLKVEEKITTWGGNFNRKDTQYSNFYNNLVVARQKSLNSGNPFHTYAQVGFFSDDGYGKKVDDEHMVTAAEIEWQVTASLAFGSKGIQYFPMVQSDKYAEGNNNGSSGLIKSDGQVNEKFSGAVTATNKFIAAADEVLMNCTNKGVIANDSNAKSYVTSLTEYNELTGVTGANALVGCFDYYGKTALLVVNCNLTNAQDITLSFNKSCTGKVTKFDTTTSDVSGNSLTLNVGAGQCSLVVFD